MHNFGVASYLICGNGALSSSLLILCLVLRQRRRLLPGARVA